MLWGERKQSIQKLQEIIKWSEIHVIGVLKHGERENDAEEIFKDI